MRVRHIILDDDGNPLPISQDVEHAFALLFGIGYITNGRGYTDFQDRIKKPKFPSRTTKPTEKEARAALARVLRANPPPRAMEFILRELANLFDPEAPAHRGGLVFKNPSQGHANPWRDFEIADLMRHRYHELGNYDKAAVEVADLAGIGDRQVKKIFQKKKAEGAFLTPELTFVRKPGENFMAAVARIIAEQAPEAILKLGVIDDPRLIEKIKNAIASRQKKK
jgi:hypothetical protein